ncbi:MAG TPA: OmpH family outer membrane protein [Nitrospiria bacterium]|nr:OmpH family outer membrane protein [Nitrospiria bacterium]
MRRREMLWAVVVAVLVWGGSALADELKIGYVDAQAVLDQSKPGQASKEVLEQYVKSRQQLIDTDEEEIRQLEEDLKKQSAVLSADAQKEKQEALQRKYISYQKRAGELTKEVQDRRAEVLKDFNRQLVQAVQHVADRGGYAMVLDKEIEGGVVLYAKEPMNLTDQVVKELDRMAAAGEAAPKPSSKTDKPGTSGKSP